MFGPVEQTLARENVGHQGRFGQARGGTLLLSEIAALPLNLQDKLLRALGGQGGGRSVGVDVRVVATAHSNLEDLVGRGKFRRELYGSLNASRIKMPALSQRGEDILALIAYFLSRYSDGLGGGLTLMTRPSIFCWAMTGRAMFGSWKMLLSGSSPWAREVWWQ